MVLLSAAQLESMRAAVGATQLLMTMDVERAVPGEADPYGHPEEQWGALHTALPCFWWEEHAREVEGPNVAVLVARQWAVVPAGTDITARDRVAAVYDAAGAVLKGPLRVRGVRPRLAETVLVLEEVAS